MRNLRLTTLALTFALLTMAGCTSSDEKPDRTLDESRPCEKLLGREGKAWLKEHNAVSKVHPKTSEKISYARAEFRRLATTEKHYLVDEQSISGSSMCRAWDPERGVGYDLMLDYSAIKQPFDKYPDVDGSLSSATLGRDVKIAYRESRHLDKRRYFINVRCGIPGASASQLNDITLEGWMSDALTNNSSYHAHFELLLHSAKVMTDAFKCTNNPQIPTTLPSSIKD
ncbi:hypothetical protein [Streptomyces flavofungini]|uniref:hypothetical protein n=1 Tax=Streptomyces flavofungini TaxID=68200 RepID=UPI0025B1C6AB|nr:hypothetical protein [Streptomyces flavofungini]WJV47793.1 hypothetical protein QUY26_21105 [Streptomyces flavofungini]